MLVDLQVHQGKATPTGLPIAQFVPALEEPARRSRFLQ